MNRIRCAIAAVAMAGMLAACGASDDAAGDGVASLGSTTTSPDGHQQTTATSIDPKEAILAYSQCMRDEGIDMPDPQITSSGNGAIVASRAVDEDEGPNVDFDSEEFAAADELCRPIMDEAIGDVEIDPERQAEMREQMLAYAECMREQGIDFPDPEFGANGSVSLRVGGPDDGPMSDADRQRFDAANEACAKDDGPIAVGVAPAGDAD